MDMMMSHSLLLDHGSDANACNKPRWTPLIQRIKVIKVSRNGYFDLARPLIDPGANLNAPEEGC